MAHLVEKSYQNVPDLNRTLNGLWNKFRAFTRVDSENALTVLFTSDQDRAVVEFMQNEMGETASQQASAETPQNEEQQAQSASEQASTEAS